jgi:hypothetical protein
MDFDENFYSALPQGVIATGGTITNYTEGSISYRAHIFTNSGTLTVTSGGTIDALVVAGGGGGGGNDQGAGGGAGGFEQTFMLMGA